MGLFDSMLFYTEFCDLLSLWAGFALFSLSKAVLIKEDVPFTVKADMAENGRNLLSVALEDGFSSQVKCHLCCLLLENSMNDLNK